MTDAQQEQESPGVEKWSKSVQITRALGLPFTSVVAAIQFVRGWRSGAFNADGLEAVITSAIYLGLTVYYPIHAAVVWIRKRIEAGLNPASDAPKIVPPAVVTAAIRVTKDLAK